MQTISAINTTYPTIGMKYANVNRMAVPRIIHILIYNLFSTACCFNASKPVAGRSRAVLASAILKDFFYLEQKRRHTL